MSQPAGLTDTDRAQLTAVKGLVEWLAEASHLPQDELQRQIVTCARHRPADTEPRQLPRQLVARELLAYYGHTALAACDLQPYTLAVGGQRLDLSVVTKPTWTNTAVPLVSPGAPNQARPGERCTLVGDVLSTATIASPEVLSAAIARLASTLVARRSGAEPVMVNKPLYRLVDLTMARSHMEARFALDWFAHYALTYDLLEQELRMAVGGNIPNHLPLRDCLLASAADVANTSQRLCAGGFACLFAIARPESWSHPADFLVVVQRRSSRVLNLRGALSVIPKGFHQHLVSPRDDVALGVTVHREMEEELFGRIDFDEEAGRLALGLDPHNPTLLSTPARWLADNGTYSAECAGVGLNLVTGNYDFACLVAIPQEEFWSRFGGACLPNWEADDIQTYSTADAEGIQALIADPRWSNEGLFALIEGLRRLSERFPERVSLPAMEMLT
jgi:hypothetical protein